ncbi:MAG TPA: ATP-binding protein [Fibrobacteria bacterium]|nr:ATP-binding protein [Fibrobacteria bacterium]
MIFAKQSTAHFNEMLCPVTGHAYLTRPEWLLSSSHHTYRLGVLDNEIILCQSFGRTCVDDLIQYCKVVDSILLEFRQPGRKMVLLEDYTQLGATDNATRQTYINFHLAHQDDLHGILFFGLNPFLKLFVRLSRRILPLRMRVDGCDDYLDALRQAFQMLGRPFHSRPAVRDDGAMTWRGSAGHAEFHPLTDPGPILKVDLHGDLAPSDIPSLFRAVEEFLVRQSPPAGRYIKVVDYSDVRSADVLALLAGARELNRLDRLFPARRHVAIGFLRRWRFLMLAMNISYLRKMSFVESRAELESVLDDLSRKDSAFQPMSRSESFWRRIPLPFRNDDWATAQRLMEFIGEIQWDSSAVASNPYPPHHPFHQVASSLLVVKSDFDQLIAERLRREKELDEARERAEESNRLQARFLANVSHEIRTPLNAVIGMGELLAETDLDPQQQDLLRTMRQSGQSLLTVINDILDLSRMEAGEFRLSNDSFDVSQLLEDVGRMLSYLAINKGLDWKVVSSGNLPSSLKGDPVRLRQILVNLGGNAVKFTEKGSVEMEVKRVGTSPHGAILQFRVADTGPGIPPDRIGELFQPFRQLDGSLSRRHGGTGLGLAIAHNLVRQMGGNLGVESTPNGSVFSFRIALAEGDSTLTRGDSIPGEEVSLSGRVLVAEDNRVNQKVVLGLLGKLGVEADVAENGRLVLERLAAHPGEYQMVLMDIQMPEMDGIEAVRRMRSGEAGEEGKRIPVVALTAHAMEGDREMFLQQGMDGYLSKPIRLKDLRTSLEAWLSQERI